MTNISLVINNINFNTCNISGDNGTYIETISTGTVTIEYTVVINSTDCLLSGTNKIKGELKTDKKDIENMTIKQIRDNILKCLDM